MSGHVPYLKSQALTRLTVASAGTRKADAAEGGKAVGASSMLYAEVLLPFDHRRRMTCTQALAAIKDRQFVATACRPSCFIAVPM